MKTIKTTLLIALLASLSLPVSVRAQKTQGGKSGSAGTTAAANKLDPNIVVAIKQSQQTHSTMPSATIPIREGDKILVDVTANVSEDLRNQVTKLGGKLLESPDPHHLIRAMMPLQQMEALASHPDVISVAPGQLSFTTGTQPISR